MKRACSILATMAGTLFLASFCSQAKTKEHGLVGLRPLSRTAELDHGRNHGGSWDGTPTYADQKGNYPFVIILGIDDLKNTQNITPTGHQRKCNHRLRFIV